MGNGTEDEVVSYMVHMHRTHVRLNCLPHAFRSRRNLADLFYEFGVVKDPDLWPRNKGLQVGPQEIKVKRLRKIEVSKISYFPRF